MQYRVVVFSLLLVAGAASAATRICQVTGQHNNPDGTIELEIGNCVDYGDSIYSAPTIHVDCTSGRCILPPPPRFIFRSDRGEGDARPSFRGANRVLSYGPNADGTIPGSVATPLPAHEPIVVPAQLQFASCQAFSEYKTSDDAPEDQKEMAKTSVYPRSHLLGHPTVENIGGKPGHPGKKYKLSGQLSIDPITPIITTPDLATPPWPNPTPNETKQWRVWATNWYWHEMGHASVYEQVELNTVELSYEGTDPDALARSLSTEVAKATRAFLLRFQEAYEKQTQHGKTQFVWKKIQCDAH